MAPEGFDVVDAHVHAFPPRVFEAIWRWFDREAWSIRYRLAAGEVVSFLAERGVARVVLLHYAHVPGMAAELNRFVAEVARADARAVPCATIMPGEEGARAILDEALGPLGCRGVKIHCHVQRVAPDATALDDVYDAAAAHGVPLVIHAGDAPALPGYAANVRELCSPEALDRALLRHPRTTVVVPHLGAERMEEVVSLLEKHERLYLDTTMALAGYLPFDPVSRSTDEPAARRWLDRATAIVRRWPDRILYGSDFPNIPYEWDRELNACLSVGLAPADLAAVLGGTAMRLFLAAPSPPGP
ncbi:MAG: amidohydrolase [Deltaproteobacteria bacterium]|nr:amidohydrolase [Deltaproteobacteria bacterium]